LTFEVRNFGKFGGWQAWSELSVNLPGVRFELRTEWAVGYGLIDRLLRRPRPFCPYDPRKMIVSEPPSFAEQLFTLDVVEASKALGYARDDDEPHSFLPSLRRTVSLTIHDRSLTMGWEGIIGHETLGRALALADAIEGRTA
jgi:hypothetical protein